VVAANHSTSAKIGLCTARFQIREEIVKLGMAATVATYAVLGLCAISGAVAQTPDASPTSPTRKVFKYTLVAGASSKPITPPANQPVLVMGVQTTIGYRGVGQVSMLRISDSFLEWVGLESPATATITSGFSGAAGTHIVYLDYSGQVDLEVNDGNSFVVHNGASGTRTGQVTLIY
jgi:hypothetical protein